MQLNDGSIWLASAKTDSYATWPTFTENSAPKPSKAHMNMYVVTFHNDVVTAAIAAHTLPLPRRRGPTVHHHSGGTSSPWARMTSRL